MPDKTKDDGTIRSFETGASRDTSSGKLDYEGFLSPTVLLQYAKYMNMNRVQSDGQLRDSDNWQKGIPMDVYMKSMYRHFFEVWLEHRDYSTEAGMAANLCGLMFNVMGYLHEYLKVNDMQDFDGDEPTPEMQERLDKIKQETSGPSLEERKNQFATAMAEITNTSEAKWKSFADCQKDNRAKEASSFDEMMLSLHDEPTPRPGGWPPWIPDSPKPLYPECKPGCEHSCTDPCPADETTPNKGLYWGDWYDDCDEDVPYPKECQPDCENWEILYNNFPCNECIRNKALVKDEDRTDYYWVCERWYRNSGLEE